MVLQAWRDVKYEQEICIVNRRLRELLFLFVCMCGYSFKKQKGRILMTFAVRKQRCQIIIIWKIRRDMLIIMYALRPSRKYNQKSLRTYPLNWSLQPFTQIYDLVSHTSYVVCLNFIQQRQNLQLKVDCGRQYLAKL